MLEEHTNGKSSNSSVFGGKVDVSARYVEPTLVELTQTNTKLMQEEIFGPILPIMKIRSIDEG
jgi:aldehyde dehydrogenase (NAD+)